jgi:hypothetical protein
VTELSQLESILERAKARAAVDDRVSVIDIDSRTTHGPTHDYVLTNAYIGFVLPLMVELQYITKQERAV